MNRVSRDLIEALLEAAKNHYPNEFFALLSEKTPGVIDEFVAVPFTPGRRYASFLLHDIPFDSQVKGSFHSHPAGSNRPSSADLSVFSKTGVLHAIAKHPYAFLDVAFYDAQGKIVNVEWC